MTADLLGAWDSNLTTGALGLGADPRVQIAGPYSTVSTGLQYRAREARSSFDASASGFGRYLPGQAMTVGSGAARVGFQRSVSERTAFNVSAGGSYAPYFQLQFLPGSPVADLPGSSMDGAVLWRPEISYDAGADLVHRMSPRLSFDLQSSFDRRTATGQTGLNYRAGGHLRYQFNPTTSFVIGYTRQQLTNQVLSQEPLATEHQIDVGIDYRRALSSAHRLTFGFSTASTAVRTGQVDKPGRLRFAVLGTAFLSRAIGRTWSARLDYGRRLQFLEISAQPFFIDTATAGLGGNLGRRVDVRWTAGYSTSTLAAGGFGFSGWTTSVRGRVAVSRSLALSAEYLYYRYEFGDGVILPAALNPQLNRQGVRVGLTWWIPFIR
jgi:hypothetical protein